MQTMREAWTDERLDDLSHRVDRGFDRVDRDIRDLRNEMDRRFDQVHRDIHDVRGEMDTRFTRLEAKFDSMQRLTLAAYLTAIVGLIATQL